MTRWFYLMLALTALVGATWLFFFFGPSHLLKEKIPVHWNINFEPDHIVSREEGLWTLLLYPGVMAFMVILSLVLPWLSPKQFQVDTFRNVFEYVLFLVVVLFAYLFTMHLWTSMEGGPPLIRFFVGGIFLFFALIGNVMGKVQRNFWMGVRTPWTLANETVWNRTHRLTAWLWVPFGLLGFVAVLVSAPPLWCFIGLMVVALYPVLYSLLLYKKLEKQGKI